MTPWRVVYDGYGMGQGLGKDGLGQLALAFRERGRGSAANVWGYVCNATRDGWAGLDGSVDTVG